MQRQAIDIKCNFHSNIDKINTLSYDKYPFKFANIPEKREQTGNDEC